VGHACVTTGRRGFSMPTVSPGGSAPPHGKQADCSGDQRGTNFTNKKDASCHIDL